MKRFLLSVMALCLCAVMSFAAISLPYSEDFEGYGRTVTSTLYSTYSSVPATQAKYEAYVNYFTKCKVPTGWVVGNNTYMATDADPMGGVSTTATGTQRGYFPYICTNGYVTSGDTTKNYADKGTALNTYGYSSSGVNCLKLYGYYTSSASTNRTPAYAILPQLDASVENLQKVVISGKAKIASQTGTPTYIVEIGVMSDPTDMKTWTTIGQFGPGNGTSGTSKPIDFEATLKNYTGTGRYLGFRTKDGAKVSITAYIDDIYVYEAVCDAVEPEAEMVEDTTVTILLDATMVTAESMWKAKVMKGIVSVDEVDDADGTLYPELEGIRYTFYHLDPDRDYTVAVAMSCDAMRTQYSKWKVVSFKTLCKYLTMDENKVYYENDFDSEDALDCWKVAHFTSTSSSYIPSLNGSATISQKGDATNKHLKMYTTSSTPGAYAILPPIAPVDNDWSKVKLTFKMTCSTTASYNRKVKVCVVENPVAPAAYPTEADFIEIATKEITNAPKSSIEGWEEFTVTFEDYSKLHATGNRIAFMTNYNNANTYVYIDDIQICQVSDCEAPASLNADVITSDGCRIEWPAQVGKQNYRVKWTTEKITDETKATYTNWVGDSVVTGNSATISGLVANQNYYFVVATQCGEAYSDLSGVLSFRTLCPESYNIPYFNDFNSNSATGSGNGADCWEGKQFTNSTSPTQPYVAANSGLEGSGDNAYYFLSACDTTTTGTYTRSYLVAPKMNVSDLSQYMVRFFMKNAGVTASNYTRKTGLVVGVTSDPDINNIETNFVALDTIVYEGNTYQQFYVDLSPFAAKIGDAKYVVLVSDAKAYDFGYWEGKKNRYNNSNIYIDNFEVIVPPCCMQPSLSYNTKSQSSITVDIAPYKASDSQWQLAAVPADIVNVDLNNLPQGAKVYDATTTTYEMTGLKSGTTYDIYARTYCASCGSGEYSAWTLVSLTERTIDYYADSCFFGFEDSEGFEFLPGATTYKIHPALSVGNPNATSNSYIPYQVVDGTSIYAKTGKYALKLYSYSSYPGPYTIFPALDECTPEERSIRFNYRQGYHTKSTGAMTANYTDTIKIQLGLVPKGTTAPSVENFRLLQEFTPQNLTGKTCTDSEQYWETMVYNLNKVQVTDSQVCIWWPQTHSSGSWSVYIDDVQITEKAPFEVPTIKSVIATDVAVTVAWEGMTHPVNVTVYNGAEKVAEQKDVTESSATITGLNPSTSYVVKLVDATVPSAPAASSEFATDCAALMVTAENPAIFDFDNNIVPAYPSSTLASDTLYLKPDCWDIYNTYTTTKYYYWRIQRTGYYYSSGSAPSKGTTYDNYCYGMKKDGKPTNALYLASTSSYKTAYTVMPRVSGKLSDYVLDFYFRPAFHSMSTGKIFTVSPEKSFYVLAMNNAADLSTADTLYFVEYPDAIPTSDSVKNDPEGLEYWRHFVLPLNEASASSRIAFAQTGKSTAYLFIDSVQIRMKREGEMFKPNSLEVDDITSNSATLSWKSANEGASYLLTVSQGDEEILMDQPVNGLSYNLTGLTANTNYSFYVKAKSGENVSEASSVIAFNTACVAYNEETFVFSFEEDENLVQQTGATSATMLQNSCWIYENLGSNKTVSSTYFPYNQKDAFSSDEKTSTYSHSGNYSLQLYASRSTTSATPTALGRVISPEIENAAQIFSQKVLKFYYRAIYHNSKTQAVTSTSIGATYGRGVIVGVCSDPNDETTFQTLDTLYYTLNPTSADMTEENDYAWMKAFVKLDQAVGNHIWMMPLLKDTAANVLAYGRMYIDDIALVEYTPVLTTAVNNQRMGGVSAGDAYKAGDDVTVEAYPNYNFEFVQWSDGSTDNPYNFSMPAMDITLTATFQPSTFTLSKLEGESFEDETETGDTIRWVRVPGSTIDTYRQISGWTYGNAGTTKTYSTTYWPYNVINSKNTTTGVTTYQYAQDGDLALKMYAKSTGEYLSYVATPMISDMANLAGKQIQFYMRPLYCYGADYATETSRNKVSTTYATSEYAKGVIVGTCSDPTDIATFHPLNSVYYSKNVTTADYATEENNKLWEAFTVPMEGIPSGDNYIYFMATNKDVSGNTATGDGWVFIDSISFAAAKPLITVKPNDSKMGTVTGGGSYEAGTEIKITATPRYNHHFVQWSDGNLDTARTFNVETSATYTAIFAVDTFTIGSLETFEDLDGTTQRWQRVPGTSQSDTYRGTIAWTYGNVGSGTLASSYPYNVVNTSTNKYSYDGDNALRLYATSTTYCSYVVTPAIDMTILDNAEFTFYMKPTYITNNTNKDYTTYYGTSYAKTVIVGVATDPTNTATFVPVDTITYDYDAKTYEDPSEKNNFNWQKVSLNLKDNKAPYVYIMASLRDEDNKLYSSYYYMYIDNVRFIAPVTVSVSSEDEEKGSAIVVGDSIVSAGDSVTIKATPTSEYSFVAWMSGDQVISNKAEYKFQVFSNTSYVATFKRIQVTVTVKADENGSANITNYGDSATVDKYTSLTINAVPNAGYQFLKWNDGNMENPRTFEATETISYTAIFATQSYQILAKVDPTSENLGSASASGNGPDVNMYYAGATVTLTATANEGYVFDQWNDGNTDNPRQITASAEVTYYASFKRDKAVVRQGLHSGNYYTLCEPQKLTEIEGAIFFQPESWDGSRLVLAEVEEVKAGYGYMFQATSDKVLAVLTGDAVTEAVDAQDAMNGMQGTLKDIDLPQGNNYCGIMNNHLQYFGANNTMIAKRAYVIFSAISGQKAPARARRISMTTSGSNVATMLDNVRFNDDEAAAKFIIDGQLIIMKGGKMYNAQGQEL